MMTAASQNRTTPEDSVIVWSTPTNDLWVASLDDEFAGTVEFIYGHFLARDLVGRMIDTYGSIPSAQLAVELSRTTPAYAAHNR